MNNPSIFLITNQLILFLLISAIITIPLAVAQEEVIEGMPDDRGLCGPLTIVMNGTCGPDYETICSPETTVVDGKCVGYELAVTKRSEDCLIATASYGSELAPQVQMLREIRDNILLDTYSGTLFMNTFNSVYYSFSPQVAQLENENLVFKDLRMSSKNVQSN